MESHSDVNMGVREFTLTSASKQLACSIFSELRTLLSTVGSLESSLIFEKESKEHALAELTAANKALADRGEDFEASKLENNALKAKIAQIIKEQGQLARELASVKQQLRMRDQQLSKITGSVQNLKSQVSGQLDALVQIGQEAVAVKPADVRNDGRAHLCTDDTIRSNDRKEYEPMVPPGFEGRKGKCFDGVTGREPVPSAFSGPQNVPRVDGTSEKASSPRNVQLVSYANVAAKQKKQVIAPPRSALNSRMIGPWKLAKKIGAGSHGTVWEATMEGNRLAAIKLEKKNPKRLTTMLQNELHVYDAVMAFGKLTGKTQRVARIFAGGTLSDGSGEFLVMERLGMSLEELASSQGGRLTLSQALQYGYQAISCIEQVHQAGFVHRDVKPSNFMVGYADSSKLFVADFGISTRRGDLNGRSSLLGEKKASFAGTRRFASTRALEFCEQTRRDDLESLWYTLVFLLKGSLPWDQADLRRGPEGFKEIVEIRKATPRSMLYNDLPALCRYIEYVSTLRPFEEPNYAILRAMFANSLGLLEGDTQHRT